jgi:hypothetical protein
VKRWKARILASLLAALVLLQISATPAFATPTCNDFVIASDNWFRVCIEQINNGYNALAYHGSGPTYLVDFNLATNEALYGDNGAFYISAGEWRTYFFAVGYKNWAQTILLWRAGSPYFDPMYSPCVGPWC